MATPYDEIAADAMKLPLKDRVRLAQELAASLDDKIEIGVEALWFTEAERRLKELRSGQVEGVDSDEAFQNARRALKK